MKHRSISELTAIIHDKLSTDVENEIMSLAEKIKAEGKLEGETELIKKMLANGVEPAFIAKNTGFPIHKIKELQNREM